MMRILFDDSHKIVAVVDDKADFNPYFTSNQIYSPVAISDKLYKSVTITKPATDTTGKALYRTPDGKLTTQPSHLGTEFVPEMTTEQITRAVSLADAPGEWSVDDVLVAKYTTLAAGKQFWFDEFFNDSAIDKISSQASIGFNGVSIAPKGRLQFIPLTLSKSVTSVSTYVEVGQDGVSEAGQDGISIVMSIDGQNFLPASSKLSKASKTLVFAILSENDVDVPIHAFAVFY